MLKEGKFWTTKGGIVGTAHENREGKVVDFRTASRIYGDGKTITVYPPKGQAEGVEPLKLEVTRIEKQVTQPEGLPAGQQEVKEVGYATFEGLEISIFLRRYAEWYDKAAEAADKLTRSEQMDRVAKEREEERNFLKNISFEDMSVEVTTSELGKLRSGKMSTASLLRELLIRVVEKRRKSQDYWLFQEELKSREKEAGYLDRFKAELLAFDDRRKEEHKREWLARKEQT